MNQLSRGTVLAAATILGLVTATLVYVYLSKQRLQINPNTTVVVASKNIQPGTTITSDMLRLDSVPKEKVPAGTATDIDQVLDEVAKYGIRPGQPLSALNVCPKNRLSYVIPPYMRAVSVAVDPVIGVGGFLKPGDRVDVVATFAQNDASVTKTILQDVMLLAVGPDLSNADPNKAADQKPQIHATLAVMPLDAERLILADQRGKLRLALRRPDDPSTVSLKGVNGCQVIGAIPPDNPAKQQKQPVQKVAVTTPQPVFRDRPIMPVSPVKITELPNTARLAVEQSHTVQVVRGAKIEQVSVSE